MFDKDKINAFTIVPDSYKKNMPPYVRSCINSFYLIPNCRVYVFSNSEVEKYFPDITNNDLWWQRAHDNKEYQFINVTNINEDMTQITGERYSEIKKGFCSFSTDTVRLKLMKVIPNSLYFDSDIYLYDIDTLMFYLENYDNFCFSPFNNVFNWHRDGSNTRYIDFLLNRYDKIAKLYPNDYFIDGSLITRWNQQYPEHSLLQPFDSLPPFYLHLINIKKVMEDSFYRNTIKQVLFVDDSCNKLPFEVGYTYIEESIKKVSNQPTLVILPSKYIGKVKSLENSYPVRVEQYDFNKESYPYLYNLLSMSIKDIKPLEVVFDTYPDSMNFGYQVKEVKYYV